MMHSVIWILLVIKVLEEICRVTDAMTNPVTHDQAVEKFVFSRNVAQLNPFTVFSVKGGYTVVKWLSIGSKQNEIFPQTALMLSCY